MRRSSADTARRAGLIAVAAALGAALAAAGARLAGRSTGAIDLTRLRRRARAVRGHSSQPPAEQTHPCDCGATYRVAGTDRHRVYWPAGAAEDALVLGDRCPECQAPLPAGRAGRSLA